MLENQQNFFRNMKINYGLIAVQHIEGINFKILHFCGYENPPTDFDKKSLRKELESNLEFGLINKRFYVIEAEPRIVKKYAKIVEKQNLN